MIRKILITAAVLSAILLIFSLLARTGIQYAGAYKAFITRMLSERIGVPVRMERLQGDSLRLHPRLSITGLQVGVPGQELFTAHHLELDFHPLRSLFYLGPRLHQVRIAGCTVALEQQALAGGTSGRGIAPRYLFGITAAYAQNCQFKLHPNDGEPHRLTVQDAHMQHAGFEKLQLTVHGRYENEPLQLIGHARRDWRGLRTINIYAQTSLDAAPWQKLPYGSGLETQGAAGELWLDWHRTHGISGTARLYADRIRRRTAQQDLYLTGASGLFAFSSRNRQHWHVEGRQLHFSLEDIPIEVGEIAAETSKTGLLLYADRIEIKSLSAIALQGLPLRRRMREALGTMQPRGQLEQAVLRVPVADSGANWQLQATVRDLETAPWKGVPGIDNAQGQLKVNSAGGSFDASSSDVKFNFAILYPEPQQYRNAAISLYWRMEDEQILLQGRNLRAAVGEHGRVQGYFDFRMSKQPGAYPPQLSLHLDGRNVDLNLGLAHIPQAARKKMPPWVVDTGGRGVLRQLSVDVRGPMRRALLKQVEVKVQTDFEGAALVLAPSLRLENTAGSLHYTRPELVLSLRIAAGNAFSYPWSGSAELQHTPGKWQVLLDTPLAGGTLAGGDIGVPLYADLKYLRLPALQEDSDALMTATEPLQLRAQIAELRYDGKDKGSWQFLADMKPGRIVLQELRGGIDTLRIENRNDSGATLVWQTDDGGSRSRLEGEIRFCDWPQIISAYDCDILAKKPSGRMQVNLEWPGGPQNFAIADSTGTVRLRLRDGRFLQVQSPGPLRLLELFNIESMFQRLQQDLGSLVTGGEGLSYKDVTAVGWLHDGMVTLQNPDGFEVESSGGSRFMLTGTADLRRRSFDGHLTVFLAMSSNLPLLTLLLQGTPAVAAGTWAVGKVFNASIDERLKVEYRVSGSWDSLKLEPIVTPQDARPAGDEQP